MAPRRTPQSTTCVRCAAICFALALLGCLVNWYGDGAIGVVLIVALGLAGVLFTVAAHRLSKIGS